MQKSIFETPRNEVTERVAILASEFKALKIEHDTILEEQKAANKKREITLSMIESLEAELKPLEEQRSDALDLSVAMELEARIKTLSDKLAVAKNVLDRIEYALHELNVRESKCYSHATDKRQSMFEAQGELLWLSEQGQLALEALVNYSGFRGEHFITPLWDSFHNDVKQSLREKIEARRKKLLAEHEVPL